MVEGIKSIFSLTTNKTDKTPAEINWDLNNRK